MDGWSCICGLEPVIFFWETQTPKKKKDLQQHQGGRESQRGPSAVFQSDWLCFVVDKDADVTLELRISNKCNLQFLKRRDRNNETFFPTMYVYLCSLQVVSYRIDLLQLELSRQQQLGSLLGQGESTGFVCHHLTIEGLCIGPQKKRSQLSAGQFHFFCPML